MQIRNHELNTSLPDTLPELTKKGYLFKPAGPILRNAGLLLLLAILVLAAWFNQAMIVILIGLALITAVLAKLWSRYSLVGVHCRRFLSEQRIFPGEEVEFTLTLVNRKPLPLPWIRVDDKIPDDLVIKKQRRIQKAKNGFLTNTASLIWYESMKWRYYLKCSKRGYYPIGPLVMSSGDIFGFYPRTQTEDANDHIIVYPKLYPLATLDYPRAILSERYKQSSAFLKIPPVQLACVITALVTAFVSYIGKQAPVIRNFRLKYLNQRRRSTLSYSWRLIAS